MIHLTMAVAVQNALLARGWTQKELANRCGLTEKHVSRVLNGRDAGSFEVWQEFATRLQMRWEVRLA
jgi:transcriptional regulator with XRE-family HTH domain